MRKALFFSTCLMSALLPVVVYAGVSLSEVMYDLSGADNGGEWIEVANTGSSGIDMTYVSQASDKHWKLAGDGTAYGIKPYKGGAVIPPGGVAIIALDPLKFSSAWPEWSGILFDVSASSLKDKGEILMLQSPDGTTYDTLDYTSYALSKTASGDGDSLQKNSKGEWISAAPTPGSVPLASSAGDEASGPGSLQATSSPGMDNSVEPASSQSQGAQSGGKSNWPVEPQIFAVAGENKTVIVGASATFEGRAYGLKKEPLENARYVWNFGDGTVGEGKMVEHTYRYPGEYIVVLDVASGYFSGSDRIKVYAEPSPLYVSAITDGKEYFIELANTSGADIDISSWLLASGDRTFTIPKNTFVSGGKKLVFMNESTELSVGRDNIPELRYPNGSPAARFGEKRNVLSAETPIAAGTRELSQEADRTDATSVTSIAKAEENEAFKDDMPAAAATKNSRLDYTWLFGVAGITVIAAAGVIAARKYGPKEDEFEKLAREIEIVE